MGDGYLGCGCGLLDDEKGDQPRILTEIKVFPGGNLWAVVFSSAKGIANRVVAG